MKLVEPVFAKFCTFATAQIVSGDLDPTYPVLKRFYADEGIPTEQALWRTLLYVTWYNLSSAELAWTRYPSPRELPNDLRLATGTERRGFRGNNLAALHVNTLLALVRSRFGGKLSNWVEAAVGPGGKAGWQQVRGAFQQVPYGGHWSSYKWADLLKNVHGYPITAADIGVGGGGETAGPVPGMVRITGESWKRIVVDVELQQAVHDEAVRRLVPFNGLDMLETACCDFNSLSKGSYYMGHDLDQQRETLAPCSEALKKARLASFDHKYLGEFGGWMGVRKELKGHYLKTGEVLV
jgi:hypothetical protein